MPRRKHDVFICHASEDKNAVARPLAEELQRCGLDVWYDEFSLRLGDSLRQSIDRGLAHSRFGVVVISPSFIAKRWPNYELDGLHAKQMAGKRNVILPVWHKVTHADVFRFSPPLAGIKAAHSSEGLTQVADQIRNTIPLRISRRFRSQIGPLAEYEIFRSLGIDELSHLLDRQDQNGSDERAIRALRHTSSGKNEVTIEWVPSIARPALLAIFRAGCATPADAAIYTSRVMEPADQRFTDLAPRTTYLVVIELGHDRRELEVRTLTA